jgi:hypothetical protein
MEYYPELGWMLPVTAATFAIGLLLLVLFYKSNFFKHWTRPRK